jgi:hypothetical protein
MLVDVLLEPAGEEAEVILQQWIRDRVLGVGVDGRVEIRSALCLEALADLRARCYDRDLLINATFAGDRE